MMVHYLLPKATYAPFTPNS